MAQDVRRLAAIVSADVAGYSRLMGRDESGTLRRLNAHRSELIDPLIEEHGGRIVKAMGDGLLLEFPSVVAAVQCCVGVQQAMLVRNAGVPDDDAISFRVGVHLGDVIVEDDDIFGDGVNIAARIEGLAEPGGIMISDDAHRQVRDRIDTEWQDGGSHEVKNIARPVQVWNWFVDDDAGAAASTGAAAGSDQDKPSIAVLPFDNMSGDPEQEYFSDGISEDIITSLSMLNDLLVIARNSTFVYKGRAVDVKQVGRELGVRYVLEGSVRKAGERLRITGQLIDTETGAHVWAERYDRKLTDIFEVQDDITMNVVTALRVKLTEGGGVQHAARETDSLEAYLCNLRAKEEFLNFTRGAILEARRLAEEALRHDPDYAGAKVMLGWTYRQSVRLGWSDDAEGDLRKAGELVDDVLSKDPNNFSAHELMGTIRLVQRRYDEAITHGEKSIAIAPNHANGKMQLAQTCSYAGQHERALSLMRDSIRQFPFPPAHVVEMLGRALVHSGEFEEAIAVLREAIRQKNAMGATYMTLAHAYEAGGRHEEAVRTIEQLLATGFMGSLSHFRQMSPYKDPEELASHIELLRRVGLPE